MKVIQQIYILAIEYMSVTNLVAGHRTMTKSKIP